MSSSSSGGIVRWSTKATAFRVTRWSPGRRSRPERSSGRADARRRNDDANLATEQIEQHGHPTVVRQPLEDAAVFREDAVDEPHRTARLDAGRQAELDKALLALPRTNFGHHIVRQRYRVVADSHQV